MNKIMLSTILNLSNEKLSEDARLIKSYFIRLIRHMPNNVYWVDANGITLGCNDNVLKFVGVENPENVIGKSYEELSEIAGWTEEQTKAFKNDDQEVIKTGNPKIDIEEPVFHGKNGNPIYYLSNRIPLTDENNQIIGIVGISVDITAKKEAERLKSEKQRAAFETQKNFNQIAAQVAHDIRSPLTTIEILVNRFNNQLPESERLMLRNAVRRIDDIAYQLVKKYKGQATQEGYDNHVLVYLTIQEIVAEKRIEHTNKNINIDVTVKGNKSFFAVTRGNIIEYKRLLSNLMNNSINALANGGNIEILLDTFLGEYIVTIADNGHGIAADKLKQLQDENADANSGIGLGLTHARNYLKTVNGNLQIKSELGKGTEVILKMPACAKPKWLCDEIMFREDCTLIVADDDPSIHDAWRQKIYAEIEEKQNKKIKMVHFNSAEECLAWLENHPDNNIVLLSDYEYLNSSMNGLQLLRSINKSIGQKKLVTSHYENEQIINELGDDIKLLPKQLVHAIEFNLLPITDEENYSLIFIDDQEFNRNMWENCAKLKKIKIKTYNSTDAFQKDKADVPLNMPIYVDQDLGEDKESGLQFTKKLYAEGFRNLYLATSYILDKNYEWLCGIIDKRPPFM